MDPFSVRGSLAWLGPGRLLEDPSVVVQNARIAWVGPAVEAPDIEQLAGDWFLMPGIIDHHVHLGLSEPRAILHGGVTAVRDLGWRPQDIFPVVDISVGTDFEGPAVSAVGPMITAVGGYPSRAGWAPAGAAIEVDGAEQAAEAVTRIAGDDPVAIKVALNADAGPTLTDGELLAVCDTAHARRLPVVVHVQGAGQSERALGAGADELAHCPWSERLSGDLVDALARTMTVVSTLDIHSYGQPTPQLDVAVDNLRRFAAAGGSVRYGTDLGNGPIPPGIHVTEAVHLAAAGLSPEATLKAMTTEHLEPGAPADLIGLASSPFDDLRALGRVRLVIRAGSVRRAG
ncbi:MAG TPA: amidohydrolase family protein [Actinomycetota bacterium]|nr:amidohydrolase family protein [Actinomycetota bacterium]